MGKVWMITAGKGGVGTSTVTAALALALGKMEKSVAVIDGNFGFRTMDMIMGLENHILYNMIDLVTGQCTLRESLIFHPFYPNVALISPPQFSGERIVTGVEAKKMLEVLKKHFAFILIDCYAQAAAFDAFLAVSENMAVITTPDEVALRAAEKTIQLGWQRKNLRANLIVNKLIPKYVRAKEMLPPENIAQILDSPLLGTVIDDETMFKNALSQSYEGGMSQEASKACYAIAEQLVLACED